MADARPPWIGNLAIIAGALAADAACLWYAAHAPSWWAIALAAILFSFSNHTLFAIVHEAVHGVLLPSRTANELAGSMLAATFPQSFCLQRAFHLSHHRNNRTDSEFFDGIGPDDLAWVKRWQWYGILLGEYWLRVPVAGLLWLVCPWLLRRPFLRDPSQQVVRSWGGYGVLEALDRVPAVRSRCEILWAIAVQMAAWHWLGLNWTAWVCCYGAFAINWGSLQYAAHAFSERHVRNGAYDLLAPWPLRWALLNYHLHRAHHVQPNMPWTALPSLVDVTRLRPSFLGQYLAMWGGPRKAWGASPDPEPPSALDPDMPAIGDGHLSVVASTARR
jgi:fatty acid desaturase